MTINDRLEKYSEYIVYDNVYKLKHDKFNYLIKDVEKNKLKIFFIEDKESQISSATMYVNIGHIHNPSNIPGMAHYLEHMLFMGSNEYPGGSFFQQKVTENGGWTNAFTMEDCTQYFFSSNVAEFISLLNIFSKFFINPLFDIKYVKKEVSAVSSEHNKNIGSDIWRLMSIAKKFLTDEINSKFGTGNKETLLGSSNNNPEILRNELIKFYDKYYSSDLMILFISHNIIDDSFIEKITKMFEHIPLKQTIDIVYPAKTTYFTTEYEVIYVNTVTENDTMLIKWIVTGSTKYENNLRVDAFNIIGHILGHEGSGSLYELLTKRNLITILSAGIEQQYYNNACFAINIDLTTKGYENWEIVLYIIIQYIENIRDISLNDDTFFENYNEEVNKINLLRLRTMEKIDGLQVSQNFASSYNSKKIDLKYIPISALLNSSNDIRKKHFIEVLKQMTLLRSKIIIGSNKIIDTDSVDEYYGTNYKFTTKNININLINECKKIKLSCPEMNDYLSTNLSIIHPINDYDDDYCLLASDYNIYYLKKSNTYELYTTIGIFDIRLDALLEYNPDTYIYIYLYILYIKRLKNNEIYMMENANIMMDLTLHDEGIVIMIYGSYNNFDNITEKMLDWYVINKGVNDPLNKIDNDIYEMIHNELYVRLSNYQYTHPYLRITHEFKKMMNPQYTFSNKQLLKSLEKFTPENMMNHESQYNYGNFRLNAISLMTRGSIKGVLGGSIKLKHVQKIKNLLDGYIRPTELSNYYYNLEITPSDITIINENNNDNESAIGYGLFIGKYTESNIDEWIIDEPMYMLLNSYISDKFAHTLRTENEIGYVAYTTIVNIGNDINNHIFILFIVQTNRDDGNEIVKKYIENDMLDDVLAITDEQYEKMCDGLIANLTEPNHNIISEINKSFTNLMQKTKFNSTEKFDREQQMAKCLRKINKHKFFDYVKSIINNKSISVINIKPSNNQ